RINRLLDGGVAVLDVAVNRHGSSSQSGRCLRMPLAVFRKVIRKEHRSAADRQVCMHDAAAIRGHDAAGLLGAKGLLVEGDRLGSGGADQVRDQALHAGGNGSRHWSFLSDVMLKTGAPNRRSGVLGSDGTNLGQRSDQTRSERLAPRCTGLSILTTGNRHVRIKFFRFAIPSTRAHPLKAWHVSGWAFSISAAIVCVHRVKTARAGSDIADSAAASR